MLTILGKDNALRNLSHYQGIPTECLDFHELLSSKTRKVLAVTSKTIEKLKKNGQSKSFQAFIENQTSHTLIYEIGGCPISEKRVFSVSDKFWNITRQFTGLKFAFDGTNNDTIFHDPDVLPIIKIDEGINFAKQVKGNSEVFLLASSIPDINSVISTNLYTKQRFSGLIPALMYIKYAFGCEDRVNPTACWIIDDPNFRKDHYGFIDFRDLLSIAREYNAFFEIAFIPYYYNRSQQDIAELFIKNGDKLAICIHGCDHRKECCSHNIEKAKKIVNLAMARMEHHRRITGLNFSKVMVFPRGQFSKTLMSALKTAGYIGSINSGGLSIEDISGGRGFTLRTLMQPVLTEYSNMPLMVRRYADVEDISDFAMDLFLERPALIVEHQAYFRNSRDVIGFIEKINALDQNIMWKSLESIFALHGYQKIYRIYNQSRIMCLNPYTVALRELSDLKNTRAVTDIFTKMRNIKK